MKAISFSSILQMKRSRHTVSRTFKNYTDMLYDPFDHLKYWEEGKRGTEGYRAYPLPGA